MKMQRTFYKLKISVRNIYMQLVIIVKHFRCKMNTKISFFFKKNIVAFTCSDDEMWSKKMYGNIDTSPDMCKCINNLCLWLYSAAANVQRYSPVGTF